MNYYLEKLDLMPGIVTPGEKLDCREALEDSTRIRVPTAGKITASRIALLIPGFFIFCVRGAEAQRAAGVQGGRDAMTMTVKKQEATCMSLGTPPNSCIKLTAFAPGCPSEVLIVFLLTRLLDNVST